MSNTQQVFPRQSPNSPVHFRSKGKRSTPPLSWYHPTIAFLLNRTGSPVIEKPGTHPTKTFTSPIDQLEPGQQEVRENRSPGLVEKLRPGVLGQALNFTFARLPSSKKRMATGSCSIISTNHMLSLATPTVTGGIASYQAKSRNSGVDCFSIHLLCTYGYGQSLCSKYNIRVIDVLKRKASYMRRAMHCFSFVRCFGGYEWDRQFSFWVRAREAHLCSIGSCPVRSSVRHI